MRLKFSSALIAVTLIASLGLSTNGASAQTHKKSTVTKKKATVKKPTAADLQQGKDLVAKSDCLSCHKLDIKLVGPAYKDVAAKYPATEANYELLTQKVINGGSGVWGQVAMAAHPAIPPADVKKMVEYVLSIKQQ
ncbi:c-type cytochrome [Mucilaginibacter sp. X5P1]|uniref:c-type cytochrome n=1 Tax=Mucilaginibacter sp. X5P1 TaxID=2723088 RepID=UPI00160DB634|nr:c-type cytochrome [Mucilaginibacter sp. X5P1]MBB6140375.1 cytochrome c [Mucilaginibacter sp. X5P1]